MRALRELGAAWVERRRSLYREWTRIEQIEAEAAALVDELRRRRDGCRPSTYDLSTLRDAIAEVQG